MSDPVIRALFVRHLIEECDAIAEGARIRGRLSPELVHRAFESPRGAFIPGADNVAVSAAVLAELTEARALTIFRRQVASFGNSALMAATVKALLKLFGSTPHTLLRQSVRLRDAAMKGYGNYAYRQTGPAAGVLELRDYPRAFMGDTLIVVLRGTTLGVVDVTGHLGEVDVRVLDTVEGNIDVDVRW